MGEDVSFELFINDQNQLYNAIPLINENGAIDRILVVVENIDERKLLEAKLQQEAATAERDRLAADLHDSVTQELYSASLIAETLPLIWEEDPEQGQRGLKQLERLTQGALAEMRTLLLELRPTALVDQELPVLLRQLADAAVSRTQTVITTTVVGECSMPDLVKIALYRVAQEALNNVVKHARASHATVNLQDDGIQITLRISDKGCGFDPQVAQPLGLGIGIMRDRAQDIDAELNITSHPDLGTDVLVEWHAFKQE